MADKTLKIYAVFHKPSPVPQCDFIEPIQVGKTLSNIDLGFKSDNTGDNISFKNDTFCELTALYWIWRHLNEIDCDFIGLCHYRRYFILPEVKAGRFRRLKEDKRAVYSAPLNEAAVKRVASEDLRINLIRRLKCGDVIVPKAIKLSIDEGKLFTPVKIHFIYSHVKEDWDIMEATVIKLFPEYKESWQTFERSLYMHCCNMFIADKGFINDYCTWLFTIETELEKNVKISPHAYQSRIFGFFSERLLNLYLWHNKINISEFPVLELK